ncbi:MAG: tetratricopeptide repeat protein [Marinifilaceae bacterium]
MKRFIIIFALLLNGMAWAQQNPISEANELYKKGEFEKAVESYQFVLNTGIESPEIYYNLANAYYKTGQVAPAILNYERAKLLAPNDKDIAYNLDLARKHVVDKLEVLPEFFITRWFKGLRTDLSADTWGLLSIVLFLSFLVCAGLYLFSHRGGIKKLGFFLGILALVFSFTFYNFGAKQNKVMTQRNQAIVFTPSVTIKGSPDESGTELFLLHEGTKVKIIDSLGEWRNIQLSDGNEGWLKKEDIQVI